MIARTWVEGELVNASKMNTLRDDILELQTLASPKSIQRGTISIPGDGASTSGTAALSPAVVLAKAEIKHLGWVGSVSGSQRPTDVNLTNTTTVTADARTPSGSIEVRTRFEVTEWN